MTLPGGGTTFLAVTIPGGAEWLIILFIILLLFGAKKLPDLAGSVGKSIKEFRRGTEEADAPEGDAEAREEQQPPARRDPES